MMSKSEITNLIRNADRSEINHIIEQLEKKGIVSDYNLSLSRIVFDQAGVELLEHIKTRGFSGDLFFIGNYMEYVGNVYAIYDTSRFDIEQARKWLYDQNIVAQRANLANQDFS